MSVIIKGMEMPRCCEVCPFFANGGWFKMCVINGENIKSTTVDYKTNCCPLVEIPKGHKIGDLTVLAQKFADTCVGDCGCCGGAFDWKEDCHCLVVKDAPAILEAESEEE